MTPLPLFPPPCAADFPAEAAERPCLVRCVCGPETGRQHGHAGLCVWMRPDGAWGVETTGEAAWAAMEDRT